MNIFLLKDNRRKILYFFKIFLEKT